MNDCNMDFHEKRLGRIERQNRCLAVSCAVAMLLAASAIVFAATMSSKRRVLTNTDDVIEAREFVLRDATDHVRARLALDRQTDVPSLRLYNGDGTPTAELWPSALTFRVGEKEGSTFKFNGMTVDDDKGNQPIAVEWGSSGTGRITLGRFGHSKVDLAVYEANSKDEGDAAFLSVANGKGGSVGLASSRDASQLEVCFEPECSLNARAIVTADGPNVLLGRPGIGQIDLAGC